MSSQDTSRGIDARTWALIVWGLYLASIVTLGVVYPVGLIIAYVKRAELAGTPFESHMTSAIRTFWISLLVSIAGIILAFVAFGAAMVLLFIAPLWWLFRVTRGLIKALDGKAIANPTGWL